MIRYATKNDIQAIVDIHVAALPNDFLPRIGKNYLRKHFYPNVLESNHGFTIVDIEKDEVRSFVTFAYDSSELTNQAMGNRLILAMYLFLGILRNSALLTEIISRLRGFTTELHSHINCRIEEIPELYLMATAPDHYSMGIGSLLVERGLEILSEKKDQCIVKTSSDRAKKFYMKHRFEEIGFEYRQGRKLSLLLCRLHEEREYAL